MKKKYDHALDLGYIDEQIAECEMRMNKCPICGKRMIWFVETLLCPVCDNKQLFELKYDYDMQKENKK